MIINVLMIFGGLLLLIVGAEFLIRGASNIAKKFHIPEILIGLTIVSIGTSMPELFITIKSALQNSTDLIIGNSIGSDLCNLLLILGIMAVIKPIQINEETKNFHIPIAYASTILILLMSSGIFTGQIGIIGFGKGLLLIILFVLYILYPILLDRKKIAEDYKKEKSINLSNEKGKNTFIQIINMLIGFTLLKWGGDLVVDCATIIAEENGVSERIIGLTIVAIGTALPELVTSIVATIKNDADLAVGNLIGSSVLNSFLILGIGGVITPLPISGEFVINLILLACTTALLWGFCYVPKKGVITRPKGLILILIFVAYLVKLLI